MSPAFKILALCALGGWFYFLGFVSGVFFALPPKVYPAVTCTNVRTDWNKQCWTYWPQYAGIMEAAEKLTQHMPDDWYSRWRRSDNVEDHRETMQIERDMLSPSEYSRRLAGRKPLLDLIYEAHHDN